MKRKLALLLVLVIALGSMFLTACGGKDDDTDSKKEKEPTSQTGEKKSKSTSYDLEEVIEGTWKIGISFQDIVDTAVASGAQMPEVIDYCDFKGVEMVMDYEFDDGTLTLSLDEDGLSSKFEKAIRNGLIKYYKEVEDSVPDEDDLDDEVQEFKEGFEQGFGSGLESMYIVEGSKITFGQTEEILESGSTFMEVEIKSENKIKIVTWETNGKSLYPKSMPITMTRK